MATPALPAPFTTTRQSSFFLPTTFRALMMPASTTIAVPCWSSLKTGISRVSFKRSSISKQRGALISSRLMPPKAGASQVTALMADEGLGGGSADGDQTGPHPGCTVCAVFGSRLCVFLWNGDYHTGISEEDAGKDVQSHAGFADQVF